ncbi:MAG: signal peptidase I [Oscillibacter sp.]|jgi:signal peptidase I|nr:signal peptidase I [Oscillibacter sp.]
MKQQENRKETKEEQKIPGRDLYEWVQALVCSVLAVVVIFTFGVRLIGVDGHSMVPTLQHGDRLLVLNSMFYDDYQYGDIVILTKETFLSAPIVKRVIAVGGQTVDIDFESGSVYVDGKLLNEPYINELTFQEEGVEFPVVVPEGSIFVMGDNRNHSDDSRNSRLGTVDTRYVIGKAVFLAFPGPDVRTEERDFGRIGVIA